MLLETKLQGQTKLEDTKGLSPMLWPQELPGYSKLKNKKGYSPMLWPQMLFETRNLFNYTIATRTEKKKKRYPPMLLPQMLPEYIVQAKRQKKVATEVMAINTIRNT